MDSIYYLNSLASARNSSHFTEPSSDMIPRVTLNTPQRPPQPPSSQCTAEMVQSARNMACGVRFNVQPLTIATMPNYLTPTPTSQNVILCQVVPSPFFPNGTTVPQPRGNPGIQQKAKAATRAWRSKHRSEMLPARVKRLKRLQQRPKSTTIKKQEVYEKWKQRNERRHTIRRRPRYNPFEFLFKTKQSQRESSVSPVQCPLWNCTERKRRSRKDFDEESQSNGKRRRRPSLTLTPRSDRSRSPVKIRRTPLI